MSESIKDKEYLASEDARLAELNDKKFTFSEFREYAARHETFMEKIHEGIEFYCKKMEIKNPSNEGFFNVWNPSEMLEIDDRGCNIKYSIDIGTCGETDLEERNLYIPIKYFDKDNRESDAERDAQKRKDDLANAHLQLQNAKEISRIYYNKHRDISSDLHKMKSMSRKYDTSYNLSALKRAEEEARILLQAKYELQAEWQSTYNKLKGE